MTRKEQHKARKRAWTGAYMESFDMWYHLTTLTLI